jgi:hypothetical protein
VVQQEVPAAFCSSLEQTSSSSCNSSSGVPVVLDRKVQQQRAVASWVKEAWQVLLRLLFLLFRDLGL